MIAGFSLGRMALSLLKPMAVWPWRMILFFLLVASAIGYGLYGIDHSLRLFSSTRTDAERTVRKFERNNPAIASEVAKLREDYGAAAVASKLRLDSEAVQHNLPFKPLKESIEEGARPFEIPLAQLAVNTHLGSRPGGMAEFFEEFYTGMIFMPDPMVQNAMLDDMLAAAETADWNTVSSSLAGPLVWSAARQDPDLWGYYARNHEWLAEPLLIALGNEAMAGLELMDGYSHDPRERVRSLLATIREHEPMVRKVNASHPDLLALAFHLLNLHGHAIKTAAELHRIPHIELLEVVYANPGFLPAENGGLAAVRNEADRGAAKLAMVYANHRTVWEHAKATPLALYLWEDAPKSADAVLDRYGNNPSFLIQLYDIYGGVGVSGGGFGSERNGALMAVVADALDRYTDLAALALNRFKDNPHFVQLLHTPDVGSRAIPFAMIRPDRLADAAEDPDWIRKYIGEDGIPIDDERWYEALPGGSIAKVVGNWRRGVPCDLSELGWAAFDVVDVGLIVFSLGASKVLTTGAKTAAKGGGRVLAGGARVLENAGQLAGRWRMAKTAGAAGRLRGGSLLRAVGRETLSSRIVRWSDDLAETIGRLRGPQAIKTIKTLACVLTAYKLYSRGDALAKAPEQIGQTLGRFTVEAAQAAGKALAGFVRELIPTTSAPWGPYVFHVFVFAILIVFAFFAYPKRTDAERRPVRYV